MTEEMITEQNSKFDIDIDLDIYEKNCNNIFNIIHSVFSAAHKTAKIYIKAKDISDLINNFDREKAIKILIEKISEYYVTITLLYPITGIEIRYGIEQYKNKSDEILKCDLKYMRNVVYCAEAIKEELLPKIEKEIKKLNIFN